MVSQLLAPAAVLTFLFGWNNSAFLIGNIRGSGTLTFRGALLTAVVGLLAGVFVEGPKMLRSLDGFLSPAASITTLAITLVASIVVTLGFTSFNLPVSFTAAMVGAFLGTALLGRGGVTGTVGDRMLVLSPQGVLTVFVTSALVIWIGTQLAVPISIGQCVLGGMFGAAYAKSVTVVNKKLAIETVSGWVVVPVAAFVLAYFASAV